MDAVNLSVVGLTIQCAGIILITSLSFFMTRSMRRAFLDYWTSAWVCMSVALVSLSVAFRAPAHGNLYFTLYYFGEYAFGFLFMAGCANYATGARPARRRKRSTAMPFIRWSSGSAPACRRMAAARSCST
jgi:hypothetical protein